MDLKSNEPFWLVKNGIIKSFPSLREDVECEVLVIGGGITGSLIAHQCIEKGYKTILIDKREIANGSSSATTSMLQYEIDVPLYQLIEKIGKEGAEASYKACFDSINQLKKICKEIKSEAGFANKKSLYFASFKKDVKVLENEFKARKDAGYDVEWVSEEDLKKKYNLHQAYAGILSQMGGSVDAFRLVHELLIYNIKKGLRVFDKTEFIDIKYHKNHNEILLETGAKIKAQKTIFCMGYEATNLIPEKFVDLLSTYAIVSEVNSQINDEFPDILIWDTADPYIYMRTTDDGRILVGGEDEEFKDPIKRDELICKKEKKLVKTFKKYFPDANFYTDFAWAGTFGETKDGLPYIGKHSGFKNSYFVLGFGGNGITFSVIGMDMVSDWLNKRKHYLSEWFQFGR
ncbi:MAG TPA: FAD-dependent oxidoreductase [Chitinophagales bacterium]|nr:FAD-dependent oxidoreductase [Chitinophagales bacterium]